jgi:hypothetical protein
MAGLYVQQTTRLIRENRARLATGWIEGPWKGEPPNPEQLIGNSRLLVAVEPPMWTEWLMGWPLGWTDLKPLEMDKSHYVQQQHGES